MCRVICAVVFMFIYGAPTLADSRPTTAELLSFHVKDRDFQPVEVAPWVRQNVLQAFVAEEDIAKVAARGVGIVHGLGPDTYYPLKRDDPTSGPPADIANRVDTYVAEARKHGLRVLVGINPAAPIALVKAHPEWMTCYTRDIEGTHAKAAVVENTPEHFYSRLLGFNSPYGDYLIECLAEIMLRFDVDGFSFDGNYHPVLNYAPYEQELFTRDTGRPFPENANLDDLDYRVYLVWADGKLEDWYRRLHARLREVKPDAAIYTWTANAGRYGHFLTSPRVMSTRMNMLFDAPIQEWWLDEVNLGSSVVPAFGAAYVRAVTGGRSGASEPYLMSRGNPYCIDNMPTHEVVARSLLAFTNGSSLGMGINGAPMFEAISQRKQWFHNAERMPWAAMLVSEQTRQFYAYRNVMDNFLSHALGVFRAVYEEHLPLDLINDWDVTPEGLAKYKVLVLPNAACLSDDQVQTISEWVAAGGGLVATCETSLFDEIGRPRGDFALKNLFGVSYGGRIKSSSERPSLDANFAIVVDDEYWAQRQGHAQLRITPASNAAHELFDDPRLPDPAGWTFKGPLVRIDAPVPPMTQTLMMFPDLGADTYPAGVIGPHGKGRVIYYPVGLDAANYSYAFRYTRLLLARSIRWAAGEPFPIEVKAPMCVQSTFFTQDDADGKRIVVHLFNDLNTLDGHGAPAADVPLREETVPIHGITIRFDGLNVQRFHVEPGGESLIPVEEGGVQTVTLPPIDVHRMLIAELGD